MKEQTEIRQDGGQELSDVQKAARAAQAEEDVKAAQAEAIPVDLDSVAMEALPDSMQVVLPPSQIKVALTEEISRVLMPGELEKFAETHGLATINHAYVREMASRGMLTDHVGLVRLGKGMCLANGEWLSESVRWLIERMRISSNSEELTELARAVGYLSGQMNKLVSTQTGILKQEVQARPIVVDSTKRLGFRPGEVVGPVNVQVNIDNKEKKNDS